LEVSGAGPSPPDVSVKGNAIKRGVCHLLDVHCGVCQDFFCATLFCSETEPVFSINMMLVSKQYDTTTPSDIEPENY
jgi:hypothetical protein